MLPKFSYSNSISVAVFSLWWHISATRYEIAFMIILDNYRDETNFPGNSIEIAKSFMIKIWRFVTVITTFCMLLPTRDNHGIYD